MTSRSERPVVAGIGISSGDRLVFPDAGVTKLDIARYYQRVAGRMLPFVADRPVSLVRLPEGLEGERFFQKHAGKGFPDSLKSIEIEEADGDLASYIYLTDAAGLVGAAQMGTVEFHVWGARRDRLDRPERLVLDLDPDESLGFSDVAAAAAEVRALLERVGLPSWPLVTGGKGVHVVTDLKRTADWESVKHVARALAAALVRAAPDRFVDQASKEKRAGRIFVDWLRNERGATAVAPFSLRARSGAPVAVPVGWDELAGLKGANAFDMAAALARDPAVPERPEAVALTADVMAAVDGLGA